MKGLSEWYIRLGEWALHLFLLNLLWLLFSVAGLVVLGIFPATAALFAVLRKLIIGTKDISIFKTFWQSFKREFLQANILGYLYSVLGAILYLDLRVIQQINGSALVNQSLTIVLFILAFLYVITFLYLFPVFVHFEMKTFGYIKSALILAIGRPFQTVLMAAGLGIILFLLFRVPGLVPVFGISLGSLVLMKVASLSFPKATIDSTNPDDSSEGH